MNTNDDEALYRGLLEATQKGFENSKVFLEAIRTSRTALKNQAILSMAEITTKHLKHLEQEVDQLWDVFKRTLKDT